MNIEQKRLDEIRTLYFRNELKPTLLTKDEYDYYYKNLITARTKTEYRSLLFFANKEYLLVSGRCVFDYNNHHALIRRRFFVEQLRSLSVIDKDLAKLVSEFPEGNVVCTNLLSTALIRKYLIRETKRTFRTVSEIKELMKPYQDLLGVIQNQSATEFFCDNIRGMSIAHLNFNKGLSEIICDEIFRLPPIIQSLVCWYSLYGT